jgi:hypothetical protein
VELITLLAVAQVEAVVLCKMVLQDLAVAVLLTLMEPLTLVAVQEVT